MAGLIPQNFIDDLLSRVDIVDVIDKRVKLRKTGKNYTACCPFHQEKTPSFSVEPEKQFYYCFGCGAGGNALGFVMNFDHKEFPEAVESLAADCGMTVPREERSSPQQQQRRSENDALLGALHQADQYFQQQLRQHPARERAVRYLKSRGLTGQIAKQFGVGLAPPGWDNLLKNLDQQSVPRTIQEKAGLIIARDADRRTAQQDSHYDRFRDRIMFPIRDSRGRVLGFGGRVLGDDKPKYLNSPETPVYHKGQELYGLYEARKLRQKPERFLIVEGYLDVMALAQHGIPFAVATLGTATSASHLTRLFRLVPEVAFCFDGDRAGRQAAWRALETSLPLMEDGRRLRFMFLPEGEDPDSLVRKEGKDAFLARVAQADSLSDWFFAHLSEDIEADSMDGRAQLFSRALPLIKRLPRGLFQQLMLDELASITGSQRETIQQLLQQTPTAVTPPSPPAPPEWLDDAASGANTTAGSGRGQHPASSGPAGPASAPTSGRPVASRQATPAGRLRNRVQMPAALIAAELLLHEPALAHIVTVELEELRILDDADVHLLVDLLELAATDPNITTYTLLGHCYDTPAGKRITQLLQNEKITPESGRRDEFRFVMDQVYQQAEQQRRHQALLERLKPHLRSVRNNDSD